MNKDELFDAIKKSGKKRVFVVKSDDEINDERELTVFVCTRCSDGSPAIPTSPQLWCERCKSAVWISPATFESKLYLKNGEVICVNCWMEQMDKEEMIGGSSETSGLSNQPAQEEKKCE